MNIGELAKMTEVSADTLRYYEKEGLLNAPLRKENGYRAYTKDHVERIRFIRGARALGFSLAEIKKIIPQLSAGKFGRAEIEFHLNEKIIKIDEHIKQLRSLKKELVATFSSLTCSMDRAVSVTEATAKKRAKGNSKNSRVGQKSKG